MTPSRNPTNTLIITNVGDAILQDPAPLVRSLSVEDNTLELVSLPKFARILIICQSAHLAHDIRHTLKTCPTWKHLRITYSIKNNNISIINNPQLLTGGNDTAKQYLELPSESGSRRFLISPPLSPHAEWDHWDREEEGPNSKSVYSPQELSNLLWERLGGFDSSQVRKYQGDASSDDESLSPASSSSPVSMHNEVVDLELKPEVLFEDIDNGVPAIVLDTVNNRDLNIARPSLAPPKTAMPPLH